MVFILLDVAVILCAYGMAEAASLLDRAPAHYLYKLVLFLAVTLTVQLIANWCFGLYGRIWRHAGIEEARNIVLSCLATLCVLTALYPLGFAEGITRVPFLVLPLGCLLTMLGIGVLRFHSRLLGWQRANRGMGLRVGVIGKTNLNEYMHNNDVLLKASRTALHMHMAGGPGSAATHPEVVPPGAPWQLSGCALSCLCPAGPRRFQRPRRSPSRAQRARRGEQRRRPAIVTNKINRSRWPSTLLTGPRRCRAAPSRHPAETVVRRTLPPPTGAGVTMGRHPAAVQDSALVRPIRMRPSDLSMGWGAVMGG